MQEYRPSWLPPSLGSGHLYPTLCSQVILFCSGKTQMVHFSCSFLVLYPNRKHSQGAGPTVVMSFPDRPKVASRYMPFPLLLLCCLFLPHRQRSGDARAPGFHAGLHAEKIPALQTHARTHTHANMRPLSQTEQTPRARSLKTEARAIFVIDAQGALFQILTMPASSARFPPQPAPRLAYRTGTLVPPHTPKPSFLRPPL